LLRDVWTLRNKSKGATKEVLASWVSKALEKGLSESNVRRGFHTTGIFPFNPHAMDGKMGANEYYKEVPMDKAMDLAAIDDSVQDTLLSAQLQPASPEQRDPEVDVDYVFEEEDDYEQ